MLLKEKNKHFNNNILATAFLSSCQHTHIYMIISQFMSIYIYIYIYIYIGDYNLFIFMYELILYKKTSKRGFVWQFGHGGCS